MKDKAGGTSDEEQKGEGTEISPIIFFSTLLMNWLQGFLAQNCIPMYVFHFPSFFFLIWRFKLYTNV